MRHFFPIQELIDWFSIYKRTFPWREELSPYKVLISEVMLQQTRASVVVDYFSRWMQEFPTLRELALAPLERVIKMWEGLGYYSRARALHESAKSCLDLFEGKLPEKEKELASLKGIGPYTLAAIMSFAFHQKKAAVDGNVMRVLSRFYALEDPIDQASAKRKLENLLEEILPEKEFWVVNEALIELGALVCKKKAECGSCPLQNHCLAYKRGLFEKIPVKTKKIEITKLKKTVALIISENCLIVEKGVKGKKFADLYFFPSFEGELSSDQTKELLEKELGITLTYQYAMEKVDHCYTRYRTKLFSHVFTADKRSKNLWIEKERLLELPFSAGHRKLLEMMWAREMR